MHLYLVSCIDNDWFILYIKFLIHAYNFLLLLSKHFKDIGKDPLCSNLNINPQLLQELTSNLIDLLNPIYTEHCIILNNFENRLSNWSSQQNNHNKQSTGLDSLALNSHSINSSTEYRIGDLFVASLHILPVSFNLSV